MVKKKKTVKRATKVAKGKKPARKAAKAPVKKSKAAKQKTAARAKATRKATPVKPLALSERKRVEGKSTIAKVGNIARGVAAVAVAAVAKRLPWAKNENDPIVLLETDHRHFEKLLSDGEATTERVIKGRGEILKSLTRDLTIHEALEEQILYPALRPHTEAHDVVLEGIEEHHVADILIKELHEVRKDNEKWGAKFKVLKESIAHHIQEEESHMFRAARAALPREELLALGARMRTLKAELEG